MSHPYVKDTQIWVPTGPSDWVKGEIISLDQPSTADAETYVTLKIRYGPDQTELEYSYPLGILTVAGQSQFSAISPSSSTGTSGGTPLPGKDADGKPVALPPLRNPDELERSEDLADLSNLNEPSGMSFLCMPLAVLVVWLTIGITRRDPVLHALKERYQLRDPYTYSGIVLVCLFFAAI